MVAVTVAGVGVVDTAAAAPRMVVDMIEAAQKKIATLSDDRLAIQGLRASRVYSARRAQVSGSEIEVLAGNGARKDDSNIVHEDNRSFGPAAEARRTRLAWEEEWEVSVHDFDPAKQAARTNRAGHSGVWEGVMA